MTYLKRGVSVVLFLAGLFVLHQGFSYLFQPKNNMKEFGMENVCANGILGEKENTIDVLVLGDSESYSSITPMQIWKETGYTTYVCGAGGQPLDYTVTMLHRAFEHQTPKIVILETNAIFRKVSPAKAAITKLSTYLPVFQYHNRWKSLNWNDFTGSIKFTWTDDYKGYHYDKRTVPSKRNDHMKPTEVVASIEKLNLQYISQIHSFCEENGAQLIFLSTPSTVNWNYKRHNAVQELASQLQCEYIDLNLMTKEVPIDWKKDTRDKGDHLNHSGAVKVTRYLSQYLQEKQLLIDHREDQAYAKWNDSLKKYESIIKK